MVRDVLAISAPFVFALAMAPAALAQHGQSGAPHPSHPAQPVHTTQASHPAPAGAQAHGASSSHTTTAHGAAAKTTTTKTTTTKTATTKTTSTTLTPVQQKVATHTNLAAKLQSRLPAGTNVVAAASGFRNLGQFVAAVNVSHNLGIPFRALKADMVTRQMSLGQSIQDLRPSANVTREVERAETEARREIDVDVKVTRK